MMNSKNRLKHIFYIQNHTTYLVVKSLIVNEKILEEDCVFLLGRGFTPENTPIKKFDLTSYLVSYKICFWQNWKRIKTNKKSILKLINEHLGSNYVFYFPITNLYHIRMVANHPNCKSYNTIEDGASAYWTKEERKRVFFISTIKSFVYTLKIFLNHYFTYWPIYFLDYRKYFVNGFSKYYTLGIDGFPGYDDRRVVLRDLIANLPPEEYLNINYLFAPAALVEKKLISLDFFLNSMKNLFTMLSSREGRNKPIVIYYRFHPLTMMNDSNMRCYKDLLTNLKDFTFIEIPKELALEELIYHNNVTLITDISSLVIYANSFDKKIVAYNSIIAKYKKGYMKEVMLQPNIMARLLFENDILTIEA